MREQWCKELQWSGVAETTPVMKGLSTCERGV